MNGGNSGKKNFFFFWEGGGLGESGREYSYRSRNAE